jgi:hypothetical protein
MTPVQVYEGQHAYAAKGVPLLLLDMPTAEASHAQHAGAQNYSMMGATGA